MSLFRIFMDVLMTALLVAIIYAFMMDAMIADAKGSYEFTTERITVMVGVVCGYRILDDIVNTIKHETE